MHFRSIILGLAAISLVGAGAFFLTKILNPNATRTTYLTAVLASEAILGTGVFFSSWFDATQFIEKLLSSNGAVGRWRYKQKYLQHMLYRHRNFDVKGLTVQGIYTLELSRVFVELSIAPRSPHEAQMNPVQLPQELEQGRHTIWDFLAQTEQHLAIIGPPGSGKTTLLKHIALVLLDDQKARKEYGIYGILPVLLFLHNHVKAIVNESGEQTYTLEAAIQQDLQRWDKTAPNGWFEEQLEWGRCLIMLDGLDEVADTAQRQQVVNWVERKMQSHARNRFIVTSRPHGYRSNPLSGVSVLEVNSFNRSQQQRFIENWYLANEIQSQQKNDEGVRMDAAEGASDLLQRLHSKPKLAELAVNPLLLTMIATVHKYSSSLPGRRVELYAQICEVFLGKRQLAKGLALNLTPIQRQRVLQPLAWHMMENRQREIDAEKAAWVIKPVLMAVDRSIEPNSYLKSIEDESGLLLERESGKYAFAHQTFQEYLAAAHAQDQQLLEELLPHVAESWWHETILLYAARADGTPIIEACLSGKELLDIKVLLLAMACAEEAREVSPETQLRLDKILDESLIGDDHDRMRLIVSARLRRRLQSLVSVDPKIEVDTSPVTCAEYQLFLNEMHTLRKYYQPDHWESYHFRPGFGNQPVTGIRPADAVAFCEWLKTKHERNVIYRLPKPSEVSLLNVNMDSTPNIFASWTQESTTFSAAIWGDPPKLNVEKIKEYLARAVALDPDLGRTLAINDDIEIISSITRVLYRTQFLDLDRSKFIDFDNIRDATGNPIEDLPSPPNLSYTLDRDLGLALSRARDYARNLAEDIFRPRTQTRNNPIALAVNLDQDSVATLARNLSLALALDRAIDRNLVFTRDMVLALAGDLVRDVAVDFEHAKALGVALSYNLARAFTLERDYVRSSLVKLGLILFLTLREAQMNTSRTKRLFLNFRQWEQQMEGLIENCYGLFTDLCILEERIKGKLPAFEGIWLVAEINKDSESESFGNN